MFRESPYFMFSNFFELVKEHMEQEPFLLTSIWYNEHGWEKLVYEHKEKKDFFLHILHSTTAPIRPSQMPP